VTQAIQAGSLNVTQSYNYDAKNRLQSASESSSWQQAYAYDHYGNRAVISGIYPPVYIPGGTQTPQVASASDIGGRFPSNQTDLCGINSSTGKANGFDAAGNWLACDGSNVYDAENRLTAAAGAAFAYDGNGQRVLKTASAATTQYVYDAQAEVVAEYSPVLPAATGTHFLTADHLGSTRLVMSTNDGCSRHDFLPFGEEIDVSIASRGSLDPCYSAGANDGVVHRFTGKERDAETGLDFFEARYMSSAQGRFMSPDPSGLLAQKPQNPQSWNLYAYAMNNPLIFIDPTGLDCVYANDAGNGVESIDHDSNSGECGQHGGSWVPGYADENWAHFNNNAGMFQVGSVNGAGNNATVDYTMFEAGAQTQFNGDESSCLSGCAGFSLANANWLQGQLKGNSISGGLDGYIQFLTGRELPLSGGIAMQILAGPLNPSTDHWAGPGGMGPPGGQGDWGASMHDYNLSTNGPEPGRGITIGMYFNPTLSPAVSKALIQSNNTLIRNAGGVQGVKMGLVFGVVNAFQWYANSWK
jgi:RHS repeat-associated protein